MTANYRLTPRTVADLDAIADYTIETWGLDQLEIYLRSLIKDFSGWPRMPWWGVSGMMLAADTEAFPKAVM